MVISRKEISYQLGSAAAPSGNNDKIKISMHIYLIFIVLILKAMLVDVNNKGINIYNLNINKRYGFSC